MYSNGLLYVFFDTSFISRPNILSKHFQVIFYLNIIISISAKNEIIKSLFCSVQEEMT